MNLFILSLIQKEIAKYKRIIEIPLFISSSLASELSYNTTKREKLMSKLIRKQKLENIEKGT